MSNITIGFIVLLFAGLCQGSFGLGYKNYKPLKWEAFWGIYSLFSIIVVIGWAFIQVPGFSQYVSSAETKNVVIPILCGVLWGMSAIGFSKAVTYIGMSLVYGLSMGISAVVGSIIPLVTMENKPSTMSILVLVLGMLVTLVGIAVITKAGIVKTAEQEALEDTTANEDSVAGKAKIGLLLALLSGLGSGALNVGFDFASPIGNAIMQDGFGETGASAIQWMLVLVGGALTSVLYCIVDLTKKKTWVCFTYKGSKKRAVILFLTSIVWFAALASYGIATLLLGDMGAVTGWILFNALALLISNLWGIRSGEWNGAQKGKKILLYGNLILIISWVFIGISNAI
ncbi:L-rhamnose/proton symporter RhaT [Anaerosporobacter sp.]|uniref:L-rhamnose/proton symporter RhaT n=1 Tax=Anaerosporobacter sp. TaxID=1872529 RepID=UPI00286F443E|nr:L-rhamnose/proton symporter RhaT [Anaerosporobacter sp.]